MLYLIEPVAFVQFKGSTFIKLFKTLKDKTDAFHEGKVLEVVKGGKDRHMSF